MSRAGFSSCPFSDLRGEEATHGPESAVPAPSGGWASAGLREETHPAAWPIPAALAQNAACGGHFVCIYGTDYRIILCLCPCSVPSSGHRTETHRGAVSVVGTWGRHPGEGCCPPSTWKVAAGLRHPLCGPRIAGPDSHGPRGVARVSDPRLTACMDLAVRSSCPGADHPEAEHGHAAG